MDKKVFPHKATGEKLKQLRGDLSKTVFARNLGVPYQTYLRYETGEREIPVHLLEKAEGKKYEKPAPLHQLSQEAQGQYGSHYIAKVAALMAEMDEDTQKDICLSVEKEKLLRDLLRQKEGDKKAG